jgi:alkylation response protein AidB-like acyl-CoA dehydrogenase
VPFLPSAVLSMGLLVAGGASEDLLSGLIAGDSTAASVVEISGGRWNRESAALTAHRHADGWTIRGRMGHILNGAAAQHLVVVAVADSEPSIFVVDAAQDGVAVTVERVLDATRPMATVTLNNAVAQRLTPGIPVAELVDGCLRHTLAVLSAEQVGACERVLEMATEYARTRMQFDRAIGSFQAVKHRCADMLVALEMARSASIAAVQSVDDGDAEAVWGPSMAKAVCSEALREASHANLQIHGGIGFTWEHSAGLFVKRARTDEVLFGRPGEHWDLVAAGAELFTDQGVGR